MYCDNKPGAPDLKRQIDILFAFYIAKPNR